MKEVLAAIAGFILLVLVLAGVSYGLGWFNVGYTKTVGKAQQNAETEVFKYSQSYIDGKNQELSKYQFEYNTTKADDEKAAIRATVIHSFAGIDENILSDENRSFLYKMRN